MKNIHIMPNSPYSYSFIEMIDKANLSSEDIFIILSKEKSNKFQNQNIKYFNYKDIKEYIKLKKYKGDNIFFHSISTVSIIISKFIGFNTKNKIWILWGYDLYKYLNIELYNEKTLKNYNAKKKKSIRRKIEYIYSKKYIKKNIHYILNWNKYDVEIAEKVFKKKFNFINFFYPIDIKKNTKPFKMSNETMNIMVGNSGDPSNNHFDIFDLLSNSSEQFNVISFLSYGENEYIENVIKHGNDLFGTRFKAYKEFMPRDDYYELINNIDILILNHNRQQGVGNILPFINNKKIVFLNSQVSTFHALNDLGIYIYDVNELDLSINNSIERLEKNSCILFNHFNNDEQLKRYKKFIDKLK